MNKIHIEILTVYKKTSEINADYSIGINVD